MPAAGLPAEPSFDSAAFGAGVVPLVFAAGVDEPAAGLVADFCWSAFSSRRGASFVGAAVASLAAFAGDGELAAAPLAPVVMA